MTIEERNRVLSLLEAGEVTAAQAAQLLDTLALEHTVAHPRKRFVHVRVTSLAGQRQRFNVTIPIGLVNVAARLGTRLLPQVSASALEELVRAIESGADGRLLDLQDMEEGERIEIFAE